MLFFLLSTFLYALIVVCYVQVEASPFRTHAKAATSMTLMKQWQRQAFIPTIALMTAVSFFSLEAGAVSGGGKDYGQLVKLLCHLKRILLTN